MPTHYKGSPKERLALDTFIRFTRASSSMESRLARSAALQELTISQFGVLETLHHLGSLSQSEICTKLLKSGGNITLVIDNLEKQKLVHRQTDLEDRRVTRVSLTTAGEKLIQSLFPFHLEAILNEMNVLTPEEQSTLGKLCKKLGKHESGQ